MDTIAEDDDASGAQEPADDVQEAEVDKKPSRLEERRATRAQRMSMMPSDFDGLDDMCRPQSSSSGSRFSRRRTTVAAREGPRLTTVGGVAAAGDLAEEVSFRAGIFVDYIERKKGYDPTGRGIEHMLSVLQLTDISSYNHAAKIICIDVLKTSLMKSVVRESKERGMFKPTGVQDLRRWGHFVKRLRRDVGCLDVDVKIMLMQWKAMRMHEAGDPRSVAERIGGAGEFWSAYSDRHRGVSDRVNKGKQGRVKYGMVMDVQTGPTWRMINPSPGTLMHTEVAKAEKEAKAEAYQGMGFKARSTPNLAKRGTLFRAASASNLKSSGPDPHDARALKRMRDGLLPPLEGRHRYLNECDKQHRAPLQVPCVTGHSKNFIFDGRNLVDKELLTLASVLEEMEDVCEVSLFDNGLLTDRGLSRFLESLRTEQVLQSLTRLNLGRCSRGAAEMFTSVTAFAKDCATLKELNLSQIAIATKLQVGLCQAIGKHPALESVNLSETGLLPNEITKQCIDWILASSKIKSLDLSWNCFDGACFQWLGERVTDNYSLRSLRVANCSAAVDIGPAQDTIPPLSLFLEQLSKDQSLTYLDISMNRCDFRTALILEDSLDSHKKLRELNLSQNPLGALGVRSILRLLCRDHTGLVSFNIEGCYGGKAVTLGPREAPVFSYTNPGGQYKLELWRPYDRAMLRMLYKMTGRFQLQVQDAFEKVTLWKNGFQARYEHAEKDGEGIYAVASEGDLELVYSVEKAILKRFLQGSGKVDESDNEGFLNGYLNEMRFQPGFKKVIPLFASWSELDGDDIAQGVYIDALSKDFNLSLAYLQILSQASKKMATETIMRLQHCVPGDDATEYLSSLMFNDLSDLVRAQKQMRHLLDFNVGNPTGSYKLELSNCSDYAVAERLLLLDRWEAAVDRKFERQDISQLGNGTHLRNPIFQGRNVHAQYHSVAEWKPPEHGEFQVDFVSNQHPPKGTRVLSDDLWESLMMDMFASRCPPEDRIAALRSISHNFFITSAHMRSLIGYFQSEQQRADVFIIFYMRIVDLHNAKMFRVRFESAAEVKRLQERLGYASFFPFFQPENATFELDLSKNDQRLCASMFVNLAVKEKFPHNLHDYGYIKADGTKDPMPLGVPKSWASFDTIPKDGVFSATYNCAPEYRNLNHRKDIAGTFGFFNGVEEITAEDVRWWTGLTEPPEDVINLLEWLISRYDNIEKPFVDIDGVDGNGVITLREFIEGLDNLGCTKFNKSKDKTRTKDIRINEVFRYMDLGEEGSISQEEWNVLGQLWSEFDMSIREFVHFLILTFGDDLLDAWEALDADGSGEMDEEEWQQAVTNIGYFGPAGVVFALLDSSDDGNISFDEFEVLEKYRPQKGREEDSRPATGQTADGN